jgi:chromosome segregation ATPase
MNDKLQVRARRRSLEAKIDNLRLKQAKTQDELRKARQDLRALRSQTSKRRT